MPIKPYFTRARRVFEMLRLGSELQQMGSLTTTNGESLQH